MWVSHVRPPCGSAMCFSHVDQPCALAMWISHVGRSCRSAVWISHVVQSLLREYLRPAPYMSRQACSFCACDCSYAHCAEHDRICSLQMALWSALACRYTTSVVSLAQQPPLAWQASIIYTPICLKHGLKNGTTCMGMLLDLQIAYQGFVLLPHFLAL